MDLLPRDELTRRRERLLLRSADLRQQWAQQAQVVRSPLGVADRVRSGTRWLMQHPEWPIGVALLLVLLRPGRVLLWAGYAVQGYGLYRRAQRLLDRPPGR
jgi:hypothetical protein